MFGKVLIANRGEIAVRIIRACRELGISPVAVYSEVDRDSLHVKLADEAYCVGPAPSSESYLQAERILDAARQASAEAIHPGYGFLAENAGFAEFCRQAGLVFVGPSPESMRLMGDKIASREAVQAAGVPVVPGSPHALNSAEELTAEARRLGFPVLIKASAGGGGKGMRVVASEAELLSAFQTAQGEALSAFADPTVYLERYLPRPRHIEVQILGDQQGNLIHLGERECSIQRRHQKVLEETPSPLVDNALRQRLGEAALAVARAASYQNAGTVEFLVDTASPTGCDFFFLEMNTRLQVEHPITEVVTGVDLVQEQLRIASGQTLSYTQQQIQFRGAALECRIYAEDPAQDFFPSPGLVTTLFEPSGPGIRNDSGLCAGFSIPLEYDPLISKLVAFGQNRSQAIRRMRRAISEYKIGGVKTTISFFEQLLSHPEFLAGNLHTGFIEEHQLASPRSDPAIPPYIALAAAGVEYVLRQQAQPKLRTQPLSNWRRLSWRDSS